MRSRAAHQIARREAAQKGAATRRRQKSSRERHDRERAAREWQERVGESDESLYTDYAWRIEAEGSDPEQMHRAVNDRAHQFVDRSYVERLHTLIDGADR